MDAPEIDEHGKGILYSQKADVSFVKKINLFAYYTNFKSKIICVFIKKGRGFYEYCKSC